MTRASGRSHDGGLRAVAVALVLVGLALSPRVAPAGEARVRLEDGRVSATFVAASFDQAFAEIRRATGVEIVVPPSVREGNLTLEADREPLDEFLRRVISRLDLGGFAMVFEPNGAAGRLIIVDRARAHASSEPPSARSTVAVPDSERKKALEPHAPVPIAPLVNRDLEPEKLSAKPVTTPAEVAAERRGVEATKQALTTIPLVRPAGPAVPGQRVHPFPAPDGSLIPLD